MASSTTNGIGEGDSSIDDLPPKYNPAYPEILLQPETRPIAPIQLIGEVKGIYVGLVMVETKTIEIDAAQRAAVSGVPLNDEHWLTLVSLHRTLMHEHHDFFLASQHPSATASLRHVAPKYAMASRLWRHGIHDFLEVLRYHLPQSREHMEGFIYMAYSFLALLYETVPGFDDTWIECLGEVSRYRMAIEEESQYEEHESPPVHKIVERALWEVSVKIAPWKHTDWTSCYHRKTKSRAVASRHSHDQGACPFSQDHTM